MASARDESKPYEGGLGAGGKFKKRPFRRTTPYDRPPTATRNPSGTGDRNGWLSKLVDPAQRLITYSAHKLFASVFRKRLTHAPPPPPEPLDTEANQEAMVNSPAATSTDPFVVEGANMKRENPSNHNDEGGVDELEEILKHKTFTRSEIDRLTSLLHSRTVDFSGGNEEMRSKVKPVVSYDKNEKLPETPVRENGTENHLISTAVVSPTVLDEDVASPAELAKAYMGSRPQKVSVSMLGSLNQGPMGNSALVSSKNFPSRSPVMSFVPRPSHVGSPGNGFATPRSGQVGSHGYGFATPRSLGRSALYSMARTPYSRVNSAVVLKGAGTASVAFGGPSSSSTQSEWEQHIISGSRQGVLKRRSSILDNDIGSTGPIRRIRQKSNLSSKKSIFPVSANPPSIRVAGTSSTGLDALADNGDISTPGTSRTSVPSKSSETASKIFQQLDKLVSPGAKSRSISGQTLKSLENVDSSKFLENMHDSDKSSGFHTALPDVQDSMSYKLDKAKGNDSTMLVVLPDKSVPAVNGVDTGSLMKDNNESSVKAADSTVIKSAIQLPQQKRWAFQMSANEDSLDLDDDECQYPNGAAAAAEAISVEKPSSLLEVNSVTSSAFKLKPDLRTSDGSAVVENNAGITFPVSKVAASSVPAALLASHSTSTAKEDATTEEPKIASMLSFGEKAASAKQSDAATSLFGFASANAIGTSSASGYIHYCKFTASSDTKLENSNSFATTAPGTTNYLSDKSDKNNTSTSAGSTFKFDSSKNSSTLYNGFLASSPFSYSLPTSQILNNGQSSSGGSTNYMSTNRDTFGAATASATANVLVSSTSTPSTEASFSSFTAAPIFKFASSGDPSASVSTLSAISGEATEAKTGNVASGPFGSNAFTSSGSNIFGGSSAVTGTSSTFGSTTAIVTTSENSRFSDPSSNITNSRSGFFNSTSSTVTNTGSGIFGGTSANTDKGSSIFGGTSSSLGNTGRSVFSTTTSITGTGSSIFGFSAPAASGSTTQTQSFNSFRAVSNQAFAAGTGFSTPTQSSTPIQFSSSAPSPSVGMDGSSASVAKPFGSGATFGMSSSFSATNSLSSGSGIASGTFGSNWQAPNSPIFGSSSSGFSFGSSASVTTPSSAPALFGASTGAASNSIFSFSSAPVATPSQSVFGNTSPDLVFGSTPSSNNDQMQDSMAEDTVQASPTVPTFGQPPFSPPTSGFSVGASNTSGTTSFQFGAQPSMATPQSPSPFQASSSLEFGAGGNFSMGSGGGDKSGRKFVKVRRTQRKK